MLDVVHMSESIDEALQQLAGGGRIVGVGTEVVRRMHIGRAGLAGVHIEGTTQAHIPIARARRDGDVKKPSTLLRNHQGENGIRARRLTRAPARVDPRATVGERDDY